MIEISIKVSDDDTRLTSKFLVHDEGISLSHEDKTLLALVEETKAKFKGSPTDILVKVKYTW